MPRDNLQGLYDELWQDILLNAQTTGELQATAFFKTYAAVAAENGDCGDLECSHARKEGPNGYQVDGYALDIERREFVLAISDFRSSDELQSLNLSNLGVLFRRGERFFENSLKSDFVSRLEETSDDFQVAHLIFSNADFIKRVRFIVFSNARLVARKRQVETKKTGGRILNFSILDFSRYVDIIESRTGSEPIDIDIGELNGRAIPCIKAFSGGDEYESYLVVLPGTLVAEIYSRYGARLLEQNVRTFLQARTKVNRGIINTISDRPDMFFAYNNGLTATASGIRTAPLPDGGLGLADVLQPADRQRGADHRLHPLREGKEQLRSLFRLRSDEVERREARDGRGRGSKDFQVCQHAKSHQRSRLLCQPIRSTSRWRKSREGSRHRPGMAHCTGPAGSTRGHADSTRTSRGTCGRVSESAFSSSTQRISWCSRPMSPSMN